jgi:hypothetical protein
MPSLAILLLLAATALAQTGATILDDQFADGNSQNQDLANQSVWLFNGRTNNLRTDQPGSVTIDMTPAGASSEAVWAYFTAAGAPLQLGVGDKLTVAVTFSLTGFLGNGQDIRWGVFDSLGTRNTTNLGGGQNDATFVNDPGYGLQFNASGSGSPFVLGRRAVLGNANVFNNFGDFSTISGSGASERQRLADGTPYTLTYSIERLTATSTRLSAAVTGGALQDLTYTGLESSTTPVSAFDYFAFRVGGTNFASKLTFSRLLVQYLPAPPVIASQPQPSALTVQVGADVTMAVGAAGSAIAYRWRKDGRDLAGNESAATATLTLAKVQLADAGSYTALVSNSGGSVISQPVTLRVSTTPVPPPPSITAPPANTTATVGETALLRVAASGAGLLYQWFKNGTLLPGATADVLVLANVQVADTASYHVVVSNSSGSIASARASLLVVSVMYATSISPWRGFSDLCADAPLTIDFDQAPKLGKTGRLRVFNSAGTVVDTIDAGASPQTRLIGGTPFVYSPILISGRRALIALHQTLPYGDTYSVGIEPGVFTDAGGAPYAGLEAAQWSFRTRSVAPPAASPALRVAADGSGDFCTVQAAIDAVPANNTQPVTITVAPGVYNEIVYVAAGKPLITVRGQDRDGSVIQYPNNNNANPSTVGRPLFGVDAPDFTLENITLINTTPKGGSQAEAFRGNAQRILLNRVTLKSYQDTLLLQGGGFVTGSYIEGDVDFMWGTGPVFLQYSEMKALSSGGMYTQIRNGRGQNGYVFWRDLLTGGEGVSGVFLSRVDPGVYPVSQAAFLECAIGPHVAPAGWQINNATTAPTIQFWEYANTTLDGARLDVSQRAPYSRQLTADEAATWSNPANVLGGWVPNTVNVTTVKAAPGGPLLIDWLVVNWSATPSHSARDTIALFEAGTPDSQPVASSPIGTANAGDVTFTAPARPGVYEFRLIVGGVRVASSAPVGVGR